MQIYRIYATNDGESHFATTNIALEPQGAFGALSADIPVSGLKFRENPSAYDHDWHTAPERLYVVMLDGKVEVEVSDGNKRIFKGGDVFLVEDTFGKGHKTRNLEPTKRRSLFISLDNPSPQTNLAPGGHP